MSFDGHKHFFLLNLGMDLMSHRIGKCLALRDTSRLFFPEILCQFIPQAALGLPRWLRGKESTYQCRRHKKHEFDSWVGKILWRRKWQRTPVFLPRKSHGQRNLVGYSPWGCKESDTTEWLHSLTHSWTATLDISQGLLWMTQTPNLKGHRGWNPPSKD